MADLTPGVGTWRSDLASGVKVCALRLDTVHLVHGGLSEGWTIEDGEVFFAESVQHAVEAPSGAMQPPSRRPAKVESWIEIVRYAHRELWEDAPQLGTTLVMETEDALWVYARGVHRVTLTCQEGEAAPQEVSRSDGKGRLWKLDPRARWLVEVRIEGEKNVLWTARWRPALVVAPARAAETAPPDAVAETAPSSPARLPWRLRPLVIARRQWRRHAWIRQVTMAVAALAVGAFVVTRLPRGPMESAALWLGDMVQGRYRVWVTSVPAGTKLIVDGKETGRLTPAWLVLAEGEHRVESSLGEYGTTTFSVKSGRGGRETKSVSLLGRLALGCADSSIVLYARMEGRSIGRLPAALDSVPAGRRQVSFQGRDVTPWVEEVSVNAGRTTSFLARPERVPETGVVVARAYRVGTEGLKDLPGAVVFLDGKKVGVTPSRFTVSRGVHTARLLAGNDTSPVQLLRVEGGGELYATAEFGRSPEPAVVDQISGALTVSGAPKVRAWLHSPTPIQISEMRVSVRRWGREFTRVSMSLREGAEGPVGEAVLPLTGMQAGMTLDYYVIIKTEDGEEFVSEMHTVKVAADAPPPKAATAKAATSKPAAAKTSDPKAAQTRK